MSPARSVARRVAWQVFVSGAIATTIVLGYLGFLGWVRGRNVWGRAEHHDFESGWQVIAVVVVLAACAVWAGAHRARWTGTVTAALTITVCYCIDQSTQSSDGLWALGVPLFFAFAFGGFFSVANGSADRANRRKSRDSRFPDMPTTSPQEGRDLVR